MCRAQSVHQMHLLHRLFPTTFIKSRNNLCDELVSLEICNFITGHLFWGEFKNSWEFYHLFKGHVCGMSDIKIASIYFCPCYKLKPNANQITQDLIVIGHVVDYDVIRNSMLLP